MNYGLFLRIKKLVILKMKMSFRFVFFVKFKFCVFYKLINYLLYFLFLEFFCVYRVEMIVYFDGMVFVWIVDDYCNYVIEFMYGVFEVYYSNKIGKDIRYWNWVKVKFIKFWEILLRCIWDYE